MRKANNLDWTARLVMAAGVGAAIYLIGALCWRWIDPVTPLTAGRTGVAQGS